MTCSKRRRALSALSKHSSSGGGVSCGKKQQAREERLWLLKWSKGFLGKTTSHNLLYTHHLAIRATHNISCVFNFNLLTITNQGQSTVDLAKKSSVNFATRKRVFKTNLCWLDTMCYCSFTLSPCCLLSDDDGWFFLNGAIYFVLPSELSGFNDNCSVPPCRSNKPRLYIALISCERTISIFPEECLFALCALNKWEYATLIVTDDIYKKIMGSISCYVVVKLVI